MEQGHALFEAMSRLQAGTTEYRQTESKVSDLQDDLSGALQELEAAKKRQDVEMGSFINAIHDSAELTLLEKAAWLTAINSRGSNAANFEQRVDQYIQHLQKLDRLFSQTGTPIIVINRGAGVFPSVTAFFTHESQGDVANRGYRNWVVYGQNSLEPEAEEYPFYIEIEEIGGVYESAEELKELDYESFLNLDATYRNSVIYIAGQEAIASLANTLINEGVDGDTKYGLDIAEKAFTIGIDIPSGTEALQAIQQEKSERNSIDLSKRIVHEILKGSTESARQFAGKREQYDVTAEQLVKSLRLVGAAVALGIDEIVVELEPQFAQKPSLDGPLHPTPHAESEPTKPAPGAANPAA